MKFDVIAWVKDGAWCLPSTLKRLDDVLPSECVHRKIMVDDGSCDETKSWGKLFNWEVYNNPTGGISSGANFALNKVDCPFFMSFEQDLLLNEHWFDSVVCLIDSDSVAAVSGVRLVFEPSYVRAFEEVCLENGKRSRFWGKSLDNTLYKTKIIRTLGGFPFTETGTGVDTILAGFLEHFGYSWVVNFDLVSEHLRKSGFVDMFKHQRWYASGCYEIDASLKFVTGNGVNYTFFDFLKHAAFSPIRGLQLAFKKNEPRLFILYPLLRLACCLGYK